LPPKEYDHVYKGALTVHVNQLQQNMLQAGCRQAFSGQFLLSCTVRPGYGCTIWMAPESEIVARGLTWELERLFQLEQQEVRHRQSLAVGGLSQPAPMALALWGSGKHLLRILARCRVTFAGDFFHRRAVEDVDQPAPVADKARALQ